MILRVLLLLLLAGGADAAPGAALQGGRFTLFLAGREAGTETVRVERRGEFLLLRSRVSLFRDDREHDLSLEIELEAESLRIRRLAARGVAGKVERVVTYARQDGRLSGEIRQGEEARSVALDVPDGAIPLLDPFAAPFLILAARYDRDRGVREEIPAFYPLEGEVGVVGVAAREAKAIVLDGAAELATRLFVTPDSADTANLWVDPEGRLLVCARSVAGLSAVRGERVTIGLGAGEDPPTPEGVDAFRVRFASDAGILAGTFYRPSGEARRRPAALLLSGSGPQDRNGNAPGSELQWNILATFADELARSGFSSLRYDERGVGRSGGDFSEAGFSDLLVDARAALSFLRSRDDVDPDRILLLGHSEGALLAASLAAGEEPPAAGVVLIGPPGRPLDELLLLQIKSRLDGREMPERERQRVLGDLRAYFEHVRLSESDRVAWQGRSRPAKWLREHMELDPLSLYQAVPVPALVIHGGRDSQVPVEDAERVTAALPRGSLSLLPGLDHYLMRGAGNLRDYADASRRIDVRALGALSEWLREAFQPR